MKKIGIIGGGINGLFISWELRRIGLEVDLYESKEILKQTSSASSKLIHGGIRYLEQGHLSLVKQSLIDRAWWIENAPAYCKPIKICMPVYKGGSRSLLKLYAGVTLYKFLAGKHSLGKNDFYGLKKTLSLYNELYYNNLVGSICFYDAQMHEEKLGAWVAENAYRSGVKIHENTHIEKFNADGQLVTKNKNSIYYDILINAAGPWAAYLNQNNNIDTNYNLRLIRGSHLYINRRLKGAYIFQELDGKRIVFVLPYLEKTLIGTTEKEQHTPKNIKCTSEERNYLINIYNKYMRERITDREIVGEFSGLRAIVSPKSISSTHCFSLASRESHIETIHNKFITVYGGKWTSAPSLARKVKTKVQELI